MAVQVSRERFFSPVYKFDKAKAYHGCAVIISISKFTTKEVCDREGSYSDEKMIFRILERFKIKSEILRTKEECEKNKILEKLENKAREINSAPYNYDSFYCFILSYGGHGYFYDSKAAKISLNEITQIFNPHYCPGLVMKPKLFFLQVCDPNDEIPQAGQIDTQGPPLPPGGQLTIPIQADFIVYYSLFSTSHYNYMKQDREEESGRICSAFIECLNLEMIDCQTGGTFNEIVLKVNKEMDEIISEFIDRYYSQCTKDFQESFRREKTPYYTSTAIKTLKFDYL